MPNYILDTDQSGVVRTCVDTWRNVWGFSCGLTEKFGAVTSLYLPDDFVGEGGSCASPRQGC